MTCVAVTTQAFGRYCQETLNPAFAHVWVMAIEAVAVTIAMYCIIQFYFQVKADIKEHNPLLKVLAIKLVIFLSFWQTIGISILTSTGWIKANDKFQTPDIKIGIPAMLLCIEMAIFSVFHLWAFSWQPYSTHSKQGQIHAGGTLAGSDGYQGGCFGWKAFYHAFNPWDLMKAVGRAARWLFVGRRHRMEDSSYGITTVGNDSNLELSSSLEGNGYSNKMSSFKQNSSYLDNGVDDSQGDVTEPGGIRPSYSHFVRTSSSERQNLIANAQPNPVSTVPGQGQQIPSYAPYGQTRGTTGDIGVATSVYNHNNDNWDSRTYSEPEPPRQLGHRQEADNAIGAGQVMGPATTPYPHRTTAEMGANEDRLSMPYFDPPPKGGGRRI